MLGGGIVIRRRRISSRSDFIHRKVDFIRAADFIGAAHVGAIHESPVALYAITIRLPTLNTRPL